MFGVDRKQVRTWLKNEEIIQQQKHSSKASGRGCTAKYPIMEDALYAEYKEARAKGKFLKRWWFNTRAKQLLKDHYPGKELKCSDQWFMMNKWFGLCFKMNSPNPSETCCNRYDLGTL